MTRRIAMMTFSLALVVGAGAFAFDKGVNSDSDKCGGASCTCEKDRKCDGNCPKGKCPEGKCQEGNCGDRCKRPAVV